VFTAQEIGQSRGQDSTIGIDVNTTVNTLKLREDVGPVGIELRATLKMLKLLILLNEKNAKNIGFAQVRYTLGTRNCFARRQWGKGVLEKDSLIDAKATTPNIEREFAGTGASLGVWIVSLRQTVTIRTLNAAVSVS